MWAMLEKDNGCHRGPLRTPKWTKKGQKLTHFKQCQEIKNNIEIFYQNINSCKDIVSVKCYRLETAKQFDPHSHIRPKTGQK